MSLFPAYTKSEPETSAVSEDKQPEEESTDASSWLVNPSFSVKVSQFSLPSKTSIVEFPKENKPDIIATSVEQEETVTNLSPSSEEDHKNKDSETSECVKREESPKYNSRKKSSKHKKHKSQHKHKRRKYDDDKDEKVYGTKEEKCYYEDKIREIGNLKVSTLSRPAIPLYSLRRDCSLGAVGWINISKKKKKKKRQLRYHTHLSKFYDIDAEDNKEEQEMTNNINKDTKDTVWQFEKTYRRGGGARGARVTAERKLAILDKQLWLLLRLYLELNMSKPESSHFKIESTLPEQLLKRILASNLPLTELWLRVEQLREGAHWVPWASDEECEDPQRLVFSDDVSDLLHPITTPSLLPNLAALTLTLLKVPLLPCRDTGLHVIVPHVKSWSFDSVEMLLPALFPMGTVDLDCGELLKDITKLSVGPQYLEQRLGQEHYLEFVVKVFHLCADCLPEPARTAFCIWWLRFERLLLVLDRLGVSKLAPARKKKLKSTIKDFLKQERNRNCLHFYREYALIEWELGHHDGACKILETAISAQPGGLPVVSVLNEHERAGLGSLYRTLSELYLCRSKFSSEDASVNKQKAISTLMALALGKPISKPENSSVPELQELVAVSEKYHHVGTELLEITSDVVSTLVLLCQMGAH
ncbi:hypothetical protein C0J52_25478 [Blattella germanica]|nr:hypothetical protein C0J52_25478 [Blattella germanica]